MLASLLALALLLPPGPPPDDAAPPLSHAALLDELRALTAAHPDVAFLDSLGTSTGGLDIPALLVGARMADLADRTGLLVVGDLDGRHARAAGAVLALARRLLEQDGFGDALGDHVLVFVPRPNLDGVQTLLSGAPRREQAGNGRPDDADRDGRTDEDGTNDLDGDGRITWMRVPDPEGEWVIDEHDPRALRKAERTKGERGTHRLLREGVDSDGDGELGEDGADGVEPDRNFPHRWTAHVAAAGAYPLSEPESMALAQLLFDTPGLIGVLQVGGRDTLVSVPPKAKRVDRGGWRNQLRAPLDGVLEGDLDTFKELKRRFAAAADDPEHDTKGDGLSDGSFLAWTYHEAGRLPMAARLWAPPTKLPKPKSDDAEADGDTDDDDDDDSDDDDADDDDAGDDEGDADAEDDATEDDDAPAGRRGRGGMGGMGGRRPGAGDDDADDDDADKPGSDAGSPVPAAVLAWLDADHEGAGIVPWTAFDHPEFGAIEIGGLEPGALINPPGDVSLAAVDRLTAFVTDLLGALPRVAFESIEVERAADGLYTLSAALVNTGALPTATAYAADTSTARPVRVRLGLPDGAELLNGPEQVLVKRLEGAGGRQEMRWVVSASPGDRLILHADADTVADVREEVELP